MTTKKRIHHHLEYAYSMLCSAQSAMEDPRPYDYDPDDPRQMIRLNNVLDEILHIAQDHINLARTIRRQRRQAKRGSPR